MEEDYYCIYSFPSRFELVLAWLEMRLIEFNKKSFNNKSSTSKGIVVGLKRDFSDRNFLPIEVLIKEDEDSVIKVDNVYIIHYDLASGVGILDPRNHVSLAAFDESLKKACLIK